MNKLTKSEEWEYQVLRKKLFAKKDFWNTSNSIDEQLILNRYNFLANKKSQNILKNEENNVKR